MTIEHIFSKQLTRDINGVVKAEQIDNDSVFVELDEYVITQELDRHFRRFFETYVPAIKNRNPAVAAKLVFGYPASLAQVNPILLKRCPIYWKIVP